MGRQQRHRRGGRKHDDDRRSVNGNLHGPHGRYCESTLFRGSAERRLQLGRFVADLYGRNGGGRPRPDAGLWRVCVIAEPVYHQRISLDDELCPELRRSVLDVSDDIQPRRRPAARSGRGLGGMGRLDGWPISISDEQFQHHAAGGHEHGDDRSGWHVQRPRGQPAHAGAGGRLYSWRRGDLGCGRDCRSGRHVQSLGRERADGRSSGHVQFRGSQRPYPRPCRHLQRPRGQRAYAGGGGDLYSCHGDLSIRARPSRPR